MVTAKELKKSALALFYTAALMFTGTGVFFTAQPANAQTKVDNAVNSNGYWGTDEGAARLQKDIDDILVRRVIHLQRQIKNYDADLVSEIKKTAIAGDDEKCYKAEKYILSTDSDPLLSNWIAPLIPKACNRLMSALGLKK